MITSKEQALKMLEDLKYHLYIETCEIDINSILIELESIYDKLYNYLKMKEIKEYTEDQFIDICNNGLQSKLHIGDSITLNNTYCSIYEVIGINHDDTTNTVDIMPITPVCYKSFDRKNNKYESSLIRKWINNDYLNSFSSTIQSLAKTMDVKVATSIDEGITLQDKVKLLSITEMNCIINNDIPGYSTYEEGEPYSIFTAGSCNVPIEDRWRVNGKYPIYDGYWLRSRVMRDYSDAFTVHSTGFIISICCDSNIAIVPVLRF